MKGRVDRLDVDKLAAAPNDLSKPSDVVKNDVVKKALCDELVKAVNIIDTSKLVQKTDYDAKIKNTENKIPDGSSLVKKLDYDDKIKEIESNYFTRSD